MPTERTSGAWRPEALTKPRKDSPPYLRGDAVRSSFRYPRHTATMSTLDCVAQKSPSRVCAYVETERAAATPLQRTTGTTLLSRATSLPPTRCTHTPCALPAPPAPQPHPGAPRTRFPTPTLWASSARGSGFPPAGRSAAPNRVDPDAHARVLGTPRLSEVPVRTHSRRGV